ncbi:LmeA family phospholipid-binding protein [Nostoc sp. CALU 1950]|uniref:LmeA family phospholipid-binding protein n=1 Tax=Nostoc sp. CALU 1950 TaxID=3104321 RepID=UPI003EBE39F8
MPDSPGLGEQALNKAAEIGLSSQLDEVENLDVNIKSDPLKLVQGQVDAVTIDGEGLVMQKDLRTEELEMKMTNVAINPLSVAFGKIELTKPTEANAKVVLTEADINRAFNSEYVRSQLRSQKIHINGQLRTIEPQHVDFRLPGDRKVALNASIRLVETGENQQIAFSAVPSISANGKTVALENVEYGESEEISPELTRALIDQTSEILNLSNFDLEGISLQVKQLNVELGKLTLQAEAYVEQIPSG